MAKAPHPADPLAADVTGEQGAEPVPPQPDRLMADVDPALEQQIFHIAQRTYISTTSRITSGEELNRRNGEGGNARDLRLIAACYQAARQPATLV